MPDPQQPNYRLTLRVVPGHAGPPIVRLRRLLKAALRAYGLRCVQLEELPAPGPAAQECSPGAPAVGR